MKLLFVVPAGLMCIAGVACVSPPRRSRPVPDRPDARDGNGSASSAPQAEPKTTWASDTERADMIGYGKVSLAWGRGDDGSGTALFTCESALHADMLQSKLAADLSWDRLSGIERVDLAGGGSALAIPGQGLIAIARRGAEVLAATAPDEGLVSGALAARGFAPGTGVAFKADEPHPMSMDFFDLRSISMYYPPLNVWGLEGWPTCYSRESLDLTPDFWGRFGFGHSFFEPYFGKDEIVDGSPQFFHLNNMLEKSKRNDAVVMTHLGTLWNPWWMELKYPRDSTGFDPHAISGWNPLDAMAGPFPSQHASPAAYAYAQRFTRKALENVKKAAGRNLGCYRPAGGGHPGDELNFHHMSTEFMDYDVRGQAAFRRWLREGRALDLASLGERWYGERGRFASWDEVEIPSHFEFFGGFGRGSLDLLAGWLWRPDAEECLVEGWGRDEYVPGAEWTKVDLAPSMKQLFLFGSERIQKLRQGESRRAWFRLTFDPTAWLGRHRGEQVYVVAHVGDARHEPVEVFLNGACLGQIRPKTVWCGPIAFKATALVRPGANTLCLRVANGLIRGPVFLTTEQPKRYPYLGRHLNARWIDLRDWNAHKLMSGWLREAEFSRTVLPETPMLLCSVSKHLWDGFLAAKDRVGFNCLNFTGGGSSYHPWHSGLGYVLGAYGISEEGGTISDPEGLSRELAWMLLCAQGHHNYYINAMEMLKIERATEWFSRNTRLFEIYGKSTWARPPVAVLRAARSERYFPFSAFADDWDIGRSSLQAAHVNNVYATEAELERGLCDEYPVLWDCGTSVFDEKLLAAVERYVRGGGTFVAVSVTGRHTPLDADAWPISRLTGFRVIGERSNMHVTVLPDNPLLKRLAGLTFNGNGIAINWMGANHLAEGAVALRSDDAEAVPVARWEDGTLAVGMRRLGKGRIVVLGSSFWRSMSDRAGNGVSLNGSVQTTFFNDLLAGLGIQKHADTASEDLWLRRLRTKNGLQEWIMAYNAGRGDLAGQAVSFPAERRPTKVADVVSGASVPFEWRDGEVRLEDVEVKTNRIRVFAIDSGDLTDAIVHWFSVKRQFESRASDPPERVEELPAPESASVLFDRFRFRKAGESAKHDLSWLNEPTDAGAWKDVSFGFWDELGFEATGVGLYRTPFTPKDEWRGRRIVLAFASFDFPVFLEKAAVFINGERALEYRGHGWANFDTFEITRFVREGRNELAVLVEAQRVRGAYIGQLVAYALEPLDQAMDLTDGWKLYTDEVTHREVAVPIAGRGRHLEITVRIPAAWKDDRVVLEFDVEHNWVGEVVVNDRAFMRNPFNHPYPNIMQVNLYPYVRPGEENRIELWVRAPEGNALTDMSVKRVRIGTITLPEGR